MGGMIEASAILRLSIPCTQLRIDDDVLVAAHRARARGMRQGNRIVADVVLQLVIGRTGLRKS
jgi:hypothetical protein